ncbi:hypothetical protein chiPu_0011797 [Chiloscyllium punctatum]|uniref:Uncharacterized protein n=1 Tax=Chiloscyllium punctatum TaxID=137246 RepID=A0A401SSG6_CHIPU|nr:hypothetical protein [Chiloscyllium punctatum]
MGAGLLMQGRDRGTSGVSSGRAALQREGGGTGSEEAGFREDRAGTGSEEAVTCVPSSLCSDLLLKISTRNYFPVRKFRHQKRGH